MDNNEHLKDLILLDIDSGIDPTLRESGDKVSNALVELHREKFIYGKPAEIDDSGLPITIYPPLGLLPKGKRWVNEYRSKQE